MIRLSLSTAVLAVCLASATPTLADEARLPRTLSVPGHGEVSRAPDMASVSAGVISQASTAGEALAANTRAMTAVLGVLKTADIAEKDIQTSNVSVQPRYNYDNNQPPQLIGYDVSNTVMVRVRDIGALGSLLDKLVAAGSNQINGITFEIAQPQAAIDEARKLAAEDATRKAKVYADALGLKLGSVISVSEGAGYEPPVPIVRAKAMMADAAVSVPVAAGEQTLAADVNVTWEIR